MSNNEIEQLVKDWLVTYDSALWKDSLFPFLLSVARNVVNNHGGIRLVAQDDYIYDLAIHAALRLHLFDFKKGSINGFIYKIMKNHYFNVYRNAISGCRDVKQTSSLEKMIMVKDDDNNDVVEFAESVEPYNLYVDKDFLKYYCDWFRTNADKFTRLQNRKVEKIVSVIESSNWDEKMNQCSIGNILNISHTTIANYFSLMRPYSKQIIREYLRDNHV